MGLLDIWLQIKHYDIISYDLHIILLYVMLIMNVCLLVADVLSVLELLVVVVGEHEAHAAEGPPRALASLRLGAGTA